MKKIIVGIFAFVFLFTGAQSVFAAAPFNGQQGDCNPSLGIGVYPNDIPRDSNGCWTATSINADAGDTINVAMYYHNNTNSTLTNVKGSITKSSSGPSNTYTFTGKMYSDQGSQTIGTVTLRLSSSQTLTYSSTHWMKDADAVLSDQDTSVFHNDGGQISIGSVPTGWDNYGELLAVFKVGNTVVPELCKDTDAINYNGSLPCRYEERLCKDTSAMNYNGSLPCRYEERLCKDTSAMNYNGSLPCRYPPQLCKDISAVNYNGSLPCRYEERLCKDIGALNYNGSLPCRYEQLCKDTEATNYNGSLPCRYPSQLCKDTSASNYNRALPCTYYEKRICSISSFTASDTSIEEGDSVTLKWNTEDCDDVSISDLGDVSLDGSEKVYPDEDISYVLTAYDNDGSRKTKTLRIYVDESDDDDNNDSECSITSFTASDTSIDKGDSVTFKWKTDECYDVSLTNVGNVNEDDSEKVYPSTTKSYVLTAYGEDNGKQTKSIRINVDDYDYEDIDPVVIYNTSVVTTIATNVSQTGATLNGLVTTNSKGNTSTYFEYGTTTSLGKRTSSKLVSGTSNFSDYISGLSSNTVYYFRAISENSNGTSRGAIAIFQTPGVITNTNTIQTKYVYVGGGTTVTGSASPIMLEIENRYESIGVRDSIDYTITYKNISKSILTDSVLQVVVPKGITIVNASEGTYSNDTHTLSVELDDLIPGEDGVVYMEGYVNSIPRDQAKIVSTAILVYTNTNDAQENAIAYVLNVPKDLNGNLLGASAFWSGFGGFGLIGWLLLIILILLIIIIARSYTRRREMKVDNS